MKELNKKRLHEKLLDYVTLNRVRENPEKYQGTLEYVMNKYNVANADKSNHEIIGGAINSGKIIQKLIENVYSAILQNIKERGFIGINGKEIKDIKKDEFKRMFNFVHSRLEFHAEQNAILRSGEDLKGKTMILTHTPCFECAKLIILSGIDEVIYFDDYHDVRFKEKSEEFLKLSGVHVLKIEKEKEGKGEREEKK